MKTRMSHLATCDKCGAVHERYVGRIRYVANLCSLSCFEMVCKDKIAGFDMAHQLSIKKAILCEAEPREGVVQYFQHRMASYRSQPERDLAQLLKNLKINFGYEPYVFYFLLGRRLEGYVPDFMTVGTFIEVKGRWTLEGRRKVERMKVVYPWAQLIVLDEETIAGFRREYNARVRRDHK